MPREFHPILQIRTMGLFAQTAEFRGTETPHLWCRRSKRASYRRNHYNWSRISQHGHKRAVCIPGFEVTCGDTLRAICKGPNGQPYIWRVSEHDHTVTVHCTPRGHALIAAEWLVVTDEFRPLLESKLLKIDVPAWSSSRSPTIQALPVLLDRAVESGMETELVGAASCAARKIVWLLPGCQRYHHHGKLVVECRLEQMSRDIMCSAGHRRRGRDIRLRKINVEFETASGIVRGSTTNRPFTR